MLYKYCFESRDLIENLPWFLLGLSNLWKLVWTKTTKVLDQVALDLRLSRGNWKKMCIFAHTGTNTHTFSDTYIWTCVHIYKCIYTYILCIIQLIRSIGQSPPKKIEDTSWYPKRRGGWAWLHWASGALGWCGALAWWGLGFARWICIGIRLHVQSCWDRWIACGRTPVWHAGVSWHAARIARSEAGLRIVRVHCLFDLRVCVLELSVLPPAPMRSCMCWNALRLPAFCCINHSLLILPRPQTPLCAWHAQLPSLPFTLWSTPWLPIYFPVHEYHITPRAEMTTQEQPTNEDWNPEGLTVKHPNQLVSPHTTHLTKRAP